MVCFTSGPTWTHFVGLREVADMGNGMSLRFSWGDAVKNDISDDLYYIIYYSNTRFGVFDEAPKAITTEPVSVILNLDPGKLYYCSVKAAEAPADSLDYTSLTQIGTNVYKFPSTQMLMEPIDAYGATIKVEDNTDFPDRGHLLIGFEIVKYYSKGTNEFYVEDVDRGQFGSIVELHDIDESVSLFVGMEDGNSNIQQGVADWYYTTGTPQKDEAIGQVNADEDGYRASNEDILTTNLAASDANTQDFTPYDFAGYHRPSLQDTFSGKCVSSYVGGDFNGSRGFNFQDRLISQLDTMLQVTGEPAILLRRKWTGKRCQCISLRREHPKSRCPVCIGTGFAGGYDRFVNDRAISEQFTNAQGMILIRVQPFTDDLDIVQDQGLRQNTEFQAWTLTYPTIKDRDHIVRFTEDGVEEYRYEVINVIRNKLLFGQSGRQELKLKRIDKTDQIYQFDTTII